MADKLKVFIVEDSEVERNMLTDHLSNYPGIQAKEFSSGDYFLKELIMGKVDEPDLVLLDYFLDTTFGSAKDGIETLTKLKEIYPDVKVIMLTSVDNEKVVELAMKKGALDYVVKNALSYQKLDSILQKHFSLTKEA